MSTSATSNLGGRIDGSEHVFPLRVYYEDTDAGGIVYYANYLKYAERARTDLLRLGGVEQSQLTHEHRIALAVRRCTVDYLAPARLDDLLEVRSRLTRLGGASVSARQEISRDGQALARLDVKVGCMKLEGGPARLPSGVLAALEPFCEP